VPDLTTQTPPQGRQQGGRRFTDDDDDRLVAIMSHMPIQRLRPKDWRQVQRDLDGPFTIDQIKHRWFGFLQPPLSRADFSKEERKEALRLYIDTPNNWRRIAARFGDGRSRSPEMMENILKTLTRKLRRFGLTVETRDEVDFLPEEFFRRGFPDVRERLALVEAFERMKRMRRGVAFVPQIQYFAFQAQPLPGTR
jgi:hypothetical protein